MHGWILRKIMCDRSKMCSWFARSFSQDSQAGSKNVSRIATSKRWLFYVGMSL